MTRRTVLIPGIGHRVRGRRSRFALARRSERRHAVVTLQAKGEDYRTLQQSRVGRSVGNVACLTAIDARGQVFERERSALARVALEAGFFVDQALIDELGTRSHAPRRGKSSMRIVTIRTLHEAFIHSMFRRHGELGLNIRMAAVAESRLGRSQQELRRRRFVNRMAAIASDIAGRMRRAPDVRPRKLAGVASQTGIERLPRVQQRKGLDRGLSAARVDVRFAGTVAAFAPRLLGEFLAGSETLVMRIPVERRPHVGVARFARRTADESRRLSGKRKRIEKRYSNPGSESHVTLFYARSGPSGCS